MGPLCHLSFESIMTKCFIYRFSEKLQMAFDFSAPENNAKIKWETFEKLHFQFLLQ